VATRRKVPVLPKVRQRCSAVRQEYSFVCELRELKPKKTDNAAFHQEDVLAIWGPRPTCIVTSEQPFVDLHHILGRGASFGAKPGHEKRGYFSSILNCVPLGRGVHHGPMKDTREMRRLFLRLAEERVQNAEAYGEYQESERDEEFRVIAGQWMAENPI
jgi:hypothetical protein